MAFLTVNWLGILVAASVAWAFGALYYGLLGKAWVAAQGKTMEEFKAANAGRSVAVRAAPFVLSFVAEIVIGWALYGLLSAAMIVLGWRDPRLTPGVVAALGLVIDAGHWLGVLVIVGAVVGWIGP